MADIGSQQPLPNQRSGETTGTVREALGKGRQAARGALSDAKERVGRVVLDQKGMAADRVGGYSSAVRETARSLEQEDPNVAHFARQAADRIESVADYLRESDFNRIRQDAEGVARRHPALFMGGMILAGLVLGNLAKASGQELRHRNGSEGDSDGGPEFADDLNYDEQDPVDERYGDPESRRTGAVANEGPTSGNTTAAY